MLQEMKVVDSYISFVKNVKAGQPTQLQFRSQLRTTGSCNLLYTLVAGHRDLQRHKAVRQELLGSGDACVSHTLPSSSIPVACSSVRFWWPT